jgi:hypothetical protein
MACAHSGWTVEMARKRIFWPLAAALALAGIALALVPDGFDAGWLLVAQDDPVMLADRAVDKRFSAPVAEQEIDAALKAGDVDLANSFADLAGERAIPLPPDLVERIAAANSTAARATRNVGQFARGLVTGEPDDMVGLAGTALGDLFVFGDVRDAVREGARLARGEQADELILGLACVGLTVTAATYASLGAGAPARVGLSMVKAARRTERLGAGMASWVGRSMRQVVDAPALGRTLTMASLTRPAIAVRAARDAVKLEKADALFVAARDVGRLQAKAGTRAAFDGLKLAEGPRDMSRLARLAETKGSKTRAILKLAGRAAIALTFAAFDLASWLFAALFALFGFCSAVKGTTERTTMRYVRWRKERRLRHEMRALMALQAR